MAHIYQSSLSDSKQKKTTYIIYA